MKFKKFYWSILLTALLSTYVHAQDNYASNVRTTVSDEQKLFINYDITANDGTKYFYVVLELLYEGEPVIPNSHNLFGDYGHAMTAGNKIIYWNFEDDFKQAIEKIEVNVYAYRENEPKAIFQLTPENGNFFAPCKINFKNLSENADSYEWNFGDANSGIENNSFEENPLHNFKKGGKYTISLTAYNTKLKLESIFYETIIVKEHEPTVADFKIIGFENLKKQSVPIIIEFKNLSSNADSYLWDFGDPSSGRNKNTSTETDPSHRYRNTGQYKIELIAKNSSSNLSSTKTMEIVLPGKAPKPVSTGETLLTYDKHRKMKTIWIISSATTAAAGTALLLKSSSLHNEYKTATTDAKDIRKKYETLDKIYPVAFAATIISGIQAVRHAKKQSDAKSSLGFHVMPLKEGGKLTLSYNF
jgi:PKD repeat protein